MVQMEVSHNLVFAPKYPMTELFQRHIDLNRRLFSPSNIATVLGKKRPGRSTTTSVSVYQSYDSWTVQRIKQDRTVIKQYDKYHRILRTECVSNDPRRFGVGKLLSNFTALRSTITATLIRFEALQQGVANSTIDHGELAALAQTSELGRARVPRIRLDNERIMTVLKLLAILAAVPRGFTAAQQRERYSTATAGAYSTAQTTYDLRKLRAKKILESVGKSRRYVLTAKGARITVLLYKLHHLLLAPTLAQVGEIPPAMPETSPKRHGPLPESVPTTQLETLLSKYAGNVCATACEMNRQTCVVRRWIRRESIDLEQFRHPIPNIRFDEAQAEVGDALGKLTAALDLRLAA